MRDKTANDIIDDGIDEQPAEGLEPETEAQDAEAAEQVPEEEPDQEVGADESDDASQLASSSDVTDNQEDEQDDGDETDRLDGEQDDGQDEDSPADDAGDLPDDEGQDEEPVPDADDEATDGEPDPDAGEEPDGEDSGEPEPDDDLTDDEVDAVADEVTADEPVIADDITEEAEPADDGILPTDGGGVPSVIGEPVSVPSDGDEDDGMDDGQASGRDSVDEDDVTDDADGESDDEKPLSDDGADGDDAQGLDGEDATDELPAEDDGDDSPEEAAGDAEDGGDEPVCADGEPDGADLPVDEAGRLFVIPPDGGDGDEGDAIRKGEPEATGTPKGKVPGWQRAILHALFGKDADFLFEGDDEDVIPSWSPSMPGYYDRDDEFAGLGDGSISGRYRALVEEDRLRREREEAERRLRNKAIGWLVAALVVVVALVAVMMGTCGRPDPGDVTLEDGGRERPAAVEGQDAEPDPASGSVVAVPEPEPAPAPVTEPVAEEPAEQPRLTAIATGLNDNGQCNLAGWTDVQGIILRGGYFNSKTLGIRGDGTLVATDSTGICDLDEVAGWTDLVDFEMTSEYSIGVRSDGTVVTTQSPEDANEGQFDFSGWEGIVDILVTQDYAVGRRGDGTLCITGHPSAEFAEKIGKWSNIKQLDSYRDYLIGVTNFGNVLIVRDIDPDASPYRYTLMLSDDDILEVAKWKDIERIEVNSYVALGLKKDGTVVMKSKPWVCEHVDVSGWTDIVSVSSDDYDYVVGVRSDGTVVTTGRDRAAVRDVSGWHGVKSVICGRDYLVALCDEASCAGNRQVCTSRRIYEWDKEVATPEVRDRYARLTTDGDGRSVGTWFSYRIPDGWAVKDSIVLLAYELPDDLVPDPYEIVPDGMQGTWTEQDIEVIQWEPGEYDGEGLGIGGGRWDEPYTAATGITYDLIIPTYDFIVPGKSNDSDTRIYMAEWDGGHYGIVTDKHVDLEVVRSVLDSFVPDTGIAEKIEKAGLRNYD